MSFPYTSHCAKIPNFSLNHALLIVGPPLYEDLKAVMSEATGFFGHAVEPRPNISLTSLPFVANHDATFCSL